MQLAAPAAAAPSAAVPVSRQSSKRTARKAGDQQYDFIATIVGFDVPAGRGMNAQGPSTWRVKWKRGERTSGTTPTIGSADGRVRFDTGNEARFASTIQRRSDGASLHKKLVEFVVTELRPRPDGKNDKKGSEGSLNLAAVVRDHGLGNEVPQGTHSITCGRDRPVVLAIALAATPRSSQYLGVGGDDADLMTDLSLVNTAASPDPGRDVLGTEGAELDDDLAGDDADGFDDEEPRAGSGAGPVIRVQGADGRRTQQSPSRRGAAGKSPPTVPISSPSAGGERSSAALKHRLAVLEKETERARQDHQRERELRKREQKKAEETVQALMQRLAVAEEGAGAAAAEKQKGQSAAEGSAAAVQQLAESALLLYGVLLPAGGRAAAGDAPPHRVLLRALHRWGALDPQHNPSPGVTCTLLRNAAGALAAAVAADPSERWAAELWALLLGLAAGWPQHGAAAALDAALARCRGELTTLRGEPRPVASGTHVLARELGVQPLLADSAEPPTLCAGAGVGAGTGRWAVLRPPEDGGAAAGGCDRGALLGFAAHVAACCAHCADASAAAAEAWAGPAGMRAGAAAFFAEEDPPGPLPVPPYGAAAGGRRGSAASGSPRAGAAAAAPLLDLAPRLHAAHLAGGMPAALSRCVLIELLRRIDATLFGHLLQHGELCRGSVATKLGMGASVLEGWMREALGMRMGEVRKTPPLPFCKQAQQLLLTQGVAVEDDAMWAPLTPAHRFVLLHHYAPEDGVPIPPDVLQTARERAGGRAADVPSPGAVPLPPLAAAGAAAGADAGCCWAEGALPAGVSAAAAALPQLRLLSSAPPPRRAGSDPAATAEADADA